MTTITQSLTTPPTPLFCATLQKIAHASGILSFHDLLMIASTNKANRRELLSQWNWQVFILKRCIYTKILQLIPYRSSYLRAKSKYYEQEQCYYKEASVLAKLLVICNQITLRPMNEIRQTIEDYPQKANSYALNSLIYYHGVIPNGINDIASCVQKSNFPNALNVAMDCYVHAESIARRFVAEKIDHQFLLDVPEWNPEVEDRCLQFYHRFFKSTGIQEYAKLFIAVKCAERRTHESIAKALYIIASVYNSYAKEKAILEVAQAQAQIDEENSTQEALKILDLIQDRSLIYKGLHAIARIRAQKNDGNAYIEARQIANRIDDLKLQNKALKVIDLCILPIESRDRFEKTLENHAALSENEVYEYVNKRANLCDTDSIEQATQISIAYFGNICPSIAEARAKKVDSRAFSSALQMCDKPTTAIVLTRLDRESNAAGLRKAIEMCDIMVCNKVDTLFELADRCKKEHLPRFEDPLSVVKDLINLVSASTSSSSDNTYFDLAPSYEESDAAIHIQKQRRVRK